MCVSTNPVFHPFTRSLRGLAILAVLLPAGHAVGRANIRSAFFNVYPDAEGTAVDTVLSQPGHCGVCHYSFTGGGTLNPYGLALQLELPNWPSNQKEMAVLAIEGIDADSDGFSTFIEMTDTVTFANTPTFPGLTAANVGNVTAVDPAELMAFLVPTTGGDTTPPDVVVQTPGGGEILIANQETTITWSATDAGGVVAVNIELSLDNGATFTLLAMGLTNSGTYDWYPANRPTAEALIRVEAIDAAFNAGNGVSAAVFSIVSPPGGLVPTTLRDFDMPGSQPFEAGVLSTSVACDGCHSNYDSAVEPGFNWRGSMMAQAARDPIFLSSMVIANQDAPESGDICLRCHLPRGWLQGRSVPTDGSRMLPEDQDGVSCDFCHRLVDPIYDPTENPIEDLAILAVLRIPPVNFANGMAVIDPTGARRGPFVNAAGGHPILVSPFHREAALCGTCHDVSNPAFEKNEAGEYMPGPFDEAPVNMSSHVLGPVERTYSEWFYSAYNTPEGIYAPQFGGNKDYVATCQDCHMRDVTGRGASFASPPVRDDLPLHDLMGGSAWLAGLMHDLHPDEVNEAAMEAGAARSRYMLQNAAVLDATQIDDTLVVHIINNTGHKLPTGYPEGRRVWINVRFLDDDLELVSESGAYDVVTAVLTEDDELKVYEVKPGIDPVVAGVAGLEPGPSYHFVLNNVIEKDNRIPPRGFTNAAFEPFGGAPVGVVYADGQYWDDTPYIIPAEARWVEVTLNYQSTTRELMEFLRDENFTDDQGQAMYDLWNDNGRCPPEVMSSVLVELTPVCPADLDNSGDVGFSDLVSVLAAWGPCPESECPADLDASGDVGFADLVTLLSLWGVCP